VFIYKKIKFYFIDPCFWINIILTLLYNNISCLHSNIEFVFFPSFVWTIYFIIKNDFKNEAFSIPNLKRIKISFWYVLFLYIPIFFKNFNIRVNTLYMLCSFLVVYAVFSIVYTITSLLMIIIKKLYPNG